MGQRTHKELLMSVLNGSDINSRRVPHLVSFPDARSENVVWVRDYPTLGCGYMLASSPGRVEERKTSFALPHGLGTRLTYIYV